MIYLRFGDFELKQCTRQLIRDSQNIPVGARAFDLLVLLITHRDRVVSRDEIMGAVWPSRIVCENNLNVQVSKLRQILGPDAIVTVPGHGLRFTLEVEADSLVPMVLPDRPSVVVLPFANFGTEPDLAWLADGFVEDITTELSRFRDLFVVARGSAFAYRAMPRDLRAISRDLGVRYVVEGSLRATNDRVRIVAQLIDAKTGGCVWAESFDHDLGDYFETQQRMARAVVSCIAPQIDRTEAVRVSNSVPEEPTAQGLALRAWVTILSSEMSYDRDLRDQAQALAHQALDHNPQSGLAWRVLAWAAWCHVYHSTTTSIPDTLVNGIEAASKAIAIDPTDHHARRLRALLRFMSQDAEAGLKELRLAHEMNPNCAVTLAWLGLYEGFHGDVERGVGLVEMALRRSPRDPARGSMLAALGFAQFAMRDYTGSVQSAEAAMVESDDSVTPLIVAVIAQVGNGQIDRAKDAFGRVQKIAPKLTEARLSGRWLFRNPDYLARAHIFFRIAAGLEEPEAADRLR
ncbi:winged helix-turn-helix domain-containing protein [Sedimentitalea sp.]|uniref:winged helix-turn-helix domain-containing protein n=1 Tax=Sedimentitalea sp. TaxID=2048915 RepID=UPI003298DE2E